MGVETFHLPLTWSAYWFQSYMDCQKKQGKQNNKKKAKPNFYLMYVYTGTCPLNFYCIFMQAFDTLWKLNVSHNTKTNGS